MPKSFLEDPPATITRRGVRYSSYPGSVNGGSPPHFKKKYCALKMGAIRASGSPEWADPALFKTPWVLVAVSVVPDPRIVRYGRSYYF